MRAHLELGRVVGVPIRLHYSWFAIAFLITASLAAMFSRGVVARSPVVVWSLAALTAVLFFACLLAHELSHTLVARSRGIPVRSITLFALGGIAHMEREAADAATEFRIGAVGPLTSAAIGWVCLGLARALGPIDAPVLAPAQIVLAWLGMINVTLAAFNLVPGFPLDGGRILRAAAWWWTGSQERATRIAAGGGQVAAYAFIFVGLWRMFAGAGLGGLWLALIGWFLLQASAASALQARAQQALRGTRVRDVMRRDLPAVDGGENLRAFVDGELLRTGRRVFVVRRDGHAAGIITPREVKAFRPSRWTQTTVDQAKRPLEGLRSVGPNLPAAEALEMMMREDLSQLPVMTDGQLEGLVSRGDILQLLETRGEMAA